MAISRSTTASYSRRIARNRPHGLHRPRSTAGTGNTASREPSVTSRGSSARSSANSAPAEPNTARRMTFNVMRIVDGSTGNARPGGHDATSCTVSSSTIRS